MFIGKFTSLEGVYTYLTLNYFTEEVRHGIFKEIQKYFDENLEYDYYYILEYIGSGVYAVSNGDLFFAFDTDRRISSKECYDIAFDDRNNSNSVH